jgi:hypothetical protein
MAPKRPFESKSETLKEGWSMSPGTPTSLDAEMKKPRWRWLKRFSIML